MAPTAPLVALPPSAEPAADSLGTASERAAWACCCCCNCCWANIAYGEPTQVMLRVSPETVIISREPRSLTFFPPMKSGWDVLICASSTWTDCEVAGSGSVPEGMRTLMRLRIICCVGLMHSRSSWWITSNTLLQRTQAQTQKSI